MSHSNHWYVIASARGLQEYILRSPRLIDMVGASELIESLATDLRDPLVATLQTLHPGTRVDAVGQSAGSVRLVFESEAAARTFVQLWPFLCQRIAPGLEVACAVGPLNVKGSDSIRQVEHQIDQQRNRRHVPLPIGNLAIRWASQTGTPASPQIKGTHPGTDEEVDAETAAKRGAASNGKGRLLRKCLPDAVYDSPEFQFPTDLTRFVRDDSSYVAIIHIDTNGLGKRFLSLAQRLANQPPAADLIARWKELFLNTSKALEEATQSAVQRALEPILERIPESDRSQVPIRPLVCAGDDITLILRADWAIEFTEAYLRWLPTELESHAASLPDEFTNSPLTAAAGIVFVPAKFPFYDAYEVCEKLVAWTKRTTNRSRSGISFLRLTEPLTGPDIFPALHFHDPHTDDPSRLVQTLCPYIVGDRVNDHPNLTDLLQLLGQLPDLVSPGLRELLRQPNPSWPDLESRFARVCEVLDDREDGAGRALRQGLALLTNAKDDSPRCFVRSHESESSTPIRDLLELLVLGIPNHTLSNPEATPV